MGKLSSLGKWQSSLSRSVLKTTLSISESILAASYHGQHCANKIFMLWYEKKEADALILILLMAAFAACAASFTFYIVFVDSLRLHNWNETRGVKNRTAILCMRF
jgi:succinate dehydrogenase hydrophobic anchor subunit